MTTRTIRLIESASQARPAEPDTEQLVLDTAWTPDRTDPADVRPVRPLITAALEAHQPLAEALAAVDDWAARADLAARLEVDGVSHWYRRRIVYWRWLHDRLIWRWLVAGLVAGGPIGKLVLPAGEPELSEVVRLFGSAHGIPIVGAAPDGPSAGPVAALVDRPSALRALRNRLAAPGRRRTLADRRLAMAERARGLGVANPGVLVLSDPAVHQTVTSHGVTARIDPFLGPVVEALRQGRFQPAILELGARTADDRTWAQLQLGGRERDLPGSLLAEECADPGDDLKCETGAREVARRLGGALPPLEIDGLDFGPTLAADLRTFAGGGLASALRQELRIDRLLAMVRPAAILMINEYSRPEWIVAARRRGIVTAAVQHGVIHPLHAGYILPARSAAMPLVDRTYLFGSYEARLLSGASVYQPDELLVTGAPRLDLVDRYGLDPAERAAIRTDLGVAPGARLVVFSSTSSVAVRRTVIAAAFDLVLDRPWPDVHLVIKLHPGEDDGQFYPALIAGLARARGFAAPPMTVVKQIDLFKLLGAADAHLGLHSTVLTDAVVVGTPNLIVTRVGDGDLLGYVGAGVAQPIQTGADLLAALGAPRAAAAADAARAAFLTDHFAAGPAAPRIAADLAVRLQG